jgi:hypothetical protein
MGILHIVFIIGLTVSIIIQQNQDITKETQKQDTDIQILVNDFKDLMSGIIDEEVIDNVKITMANLRPPTAGVCWPYKTTKLIYLDTKTWQEYSELQKEVLLFHELAHCVCDLDHTHFQGVYPENPVVPETAQERIKAGFLDDGCPVSIMYPKVLTHSCYKKHRKLYRYEINLRCYASKIYKKKQN